MKSDKRYYRKGTIAIIAKSERPRFYLQQAKADQIIILLVEHVWCDSKNGHLSIIPVMLPNGKIIEILAKDIVFPHQRKV